MKAVGPSCILFKMCTFAPVQWNEGPQDEASHSYYTTYNTYMINKETVKTFVNEWLQDKEYFLVDVEVTPDDRIVVEIDHKDGVWIEDCAELSRFIEDHLNRDEEDYELEVGSAGLGQPFKVTQQYINCIGEQVEVLKKDGKKLTGTLKSVDEPKFVVTVAEKKKLEGQKRPQMVETDIEFDMNEVKQTKYILNFK